MSNSISDQCFLFLLFLGLTACSSAGTPVGVSYLASGQLELSSFPKLKEGPESQIRLLVPADHDDLTVLLFKSGVTVDLLLSESLVDNLIRSNLSTISWLRALQLHMNVASAVVGSMSGGFEGENQALELFLKLESVHSVLRSFSFNKELKVSVAFSSSSLEKLGRNKLGRGLEKVFCFIKKIRSFVIIQASTGHELGMIRKLSSAASVVPCYGVPFILAVRNPVAQVPELTHKVTNAVATPTAEVHAGLSSLEQSNFPASARELLMNLKTTSHDAIDPPTTPIYNATPGIITVPSTNPVTITPAIPASTPVPVPSTTPVPVTVPSTNPNSPTVPVTNPVTTPATTPVTAPGTQPVTNPVTTYPAPTGGVPVSTPVTNPLPPPAMTNAPAVPGQSWCVARTGVAQTSLQLGLDYACGNGADCSQIQQGGSCYNPNTVQNHASYAFNSYYQRNPAATSCDFGATAAIVNTNPSTGSCIFPLSASPSTPVTAPAVTVPATTAPATTPGTGVTSSSTSPAVLNSSDPTSGTTTSGSDVPPNFNSSASMASSLPSLMWLIILVSSTVIGAVIQSM